MTRCPREQLEDTPYALERERVLAELPPVLSEQSVTVHRLLNHRNTSSSGIEMGDAVGCGAPQKYSGQLRMSKTSSTVHEYRVFAWHRRFKSDGRDTSNDTQGGAVKQEIAMCVNLIALKAIAWHALTLRLTDEQHW